MSNLDSIKTVAGESQSPRPSTDDDQNEARTLKEKPKTRSNLVIFENTSVVRRDLYFIKRQSPERRRFYHIYTVVINLHLLRL